MEVFMVMLLLVSVINAEPECPMNLDYLTRIQWKPSTCHSIETSEDLEMCSNTLRSLLGVGFAQLLRDKSIFYLPDNASAVACLRELQKQMSSMGLPSNLVSLCFSDISEFVSSPRLCGGIKSKRDWMEKLGPTPLIESACRGDLSVSSACSACHNSRQAALKRLVGRIKNATAQTALRCKSLAVLYAVGVANEYGPMSQKASSCILGLPFHPSKWRVCLEMVLYGCVGTAMAIILLYSVGISYWWWVSGKIRRFVRIHRSLMRIRIGLVRFDILPIKDATKNFSTCANFNGKGSFGMVCKGRLAEADEMIPVKKKDCSFHENLGPVRFNARQLEEATNNFSCPNLIGQGSFGIVYKGKLPDGQMIAVKRLKKCSVDDFWHEVEMMSSFRHRNLLALRGFGVAGDGKQGCHERFLVYDYLVNGSLDQHIFGGKIRNGRGLRWEQRKKIIIGIAKGLCFLHSGVRPAIYHRDIKADNILLDDDMNACIGDFGLAIREGQCDQIGSKVAGTHGYLAPEYCLTGLLTDRCDVYSFGVLLLEIMSGRNAVDITCQFHITDWVWKLLKASNKIDLVIDWRMREGELAVKAMERFVKVGILCAHVNVGLRPSMAEALKMLKGEAAIPAISENTSPIVNHKAEADGTDFLRFLNPSFKSSVRAK